MKFPKTPLCWLSLFLNALTLLMIPLNAQYIPDRTSLIMYELEQFLVDTSGANDHVFQRPIDPCINYALNGSQVIDNTFGRQSAAQWIRNAFHDFNTANVKTGIGGLDASIGFEADRATNAGPMIPDSMFFFGFFVSDMVSMADLVALGLVLAVGFCGGPHVPLRGGRIDATGPGPQANCNPDTPLDQTLDVFKQTGLTQQEGITLVACGHTMGGVHHNVFPEIVGGQTVSSTNKDGRVEFDKSLARYDNHVIQEYVSNSGDRGGPLVTSFNKSQLSDYRLYNSDKNATVKKLAASGNYYNSQCSQVMSKMLDTVPAGGKLTPVIDPYVWKPINTSLNIDWKGDLTLAGFIRYLQKPGSAVAPKSLDITLLNRSGGSGKQFKATTNSTLGGSSIFGPTTFYYYNVKFSSKTGLSGLQVKDTKIPLQDSMFVVPALSSITPGLADLDFRDAKDYAINITTAVLSQPGEKLPPYLTATFATPVKLAGSVGNRGIDKSFTAKLKPIGKPGSYYTLYSTHTTEHNITASPQLVRASVDVVGKGLKAKVMFAQLFGILAGY